MDNCHRRAESLALVFNLLKPLVFNPHQRGYPLSQLHLLTRSTQWTPLLNLVTCHLWIMKDLLRNKSFFISHKLYVTYKPKKEIKANVFYYCSQHRYCINISLAHRKHDHFNPIDSYTLLVSQCKCMYLCLRIRADWKKLCEISTSINTRKIAYYMQHHSP